MDDRTRREFLTELEELIEQLFAETEELRRRQDHAPLRRELLARIFRCVHSIKGVAASAGFDSVSELAHQVETLLDNTRAGKVVIDDSFVDTLEDAANAISQSLSATAAGVTEALPSTLLKRIRDLAEREPGEKIVTAELRLPNLPADLAQSLNQQERRLMLEALREDEKVYIIDVNFAVATFDKEFQDLRETLTHSGEVIATVPSTDTLRPDQISFRIVYAADLELPELKDSLANFQDVALTELDQGAKPATARGEAFARTLPDAPGSQASLPSSFIRVDLDELDRLISSAHEVFRESDKALDFVSENVPTDVRAELKNLDAQLRQSLMALEAQIISLRMISVGRIIQRAMRAGRVAARVAGKEIEFRAKGSDLRIDKMLCDAIADPLLHLVRNAVDHGIETSAERVRSGKSPAGLLRIEVQSEGGRARIVVADDGRGIDPEMISQAAVKQGLIEAGAKLTVDQSLRLIFRPGFSTSATVSKVSGRGVGLDVVESAIEQAGGAVRVRTTPGKGAEFEIRLPATFGVLRSLVVREGGHRYCIDAGQIVDRREVADDRNESLNWRGEMLSITSLRKLLAQSDEHSRMRSQCKVLVCRQPERESDADPQSGKHQAVMVDAIEGTQEVLVRSLGRHGARWSGVVGATELRDGGVALVLDLPALIQ